MAVQVEVYTDEDGECPFERWFDALPAEHAAKVTVGVARIAAGHRSGLKGIGGGVFEWRIDWGPGLRI